MTPHLLMFHVRRSGVVMAVCAAFVGCTSMVPEPRETSAGHLGKTLPAVQPAAPVSSIPAPVTRVPILPTPQPAAPAETYTVVVNGVPVRELLFALARDAAINVDIHPDIEGSVTLNAIEQSLPQILERLTRQVDLRYRFDGDLLIIEPDRPFLRTYTIDYVNVARSTSNEVSVATQISATSSQAGASGGGGGDNNSTTKVESTAEHQVWQTLTATIAAMLEDDGRGGESGAAEPAGGGGQTGAASRNVIANPESGLLTVRGTAKEHDQIRHFIDRVMASLQRQVLIEATVVEVTLSDRYRAGIDWSSLANKAGVTLTQSLLAGALAAAPAFILEYADARAASSNTTVDLTVTARLLKEFGDVRVISSPKVMALNNQTALLKVVDNRVYFEVDVETTTDANGVLNTTIETTPQTVPVGFVMAVTPQINASDTVTLNVRPTITRILQFVNDPNPSLNCSFAAAGAGCVAVTNPVPEVQVREFESVMRTQSGQIAVLGGLMQDDNRKDTDGLPVLSDLREIGELFKVRDNNFVKTELVVFIRPWVVRKPSVMAGDLDSFQRHLPERLERALPVSTPMSDALQQ